MLSKLRILAVLIFTSLSMSAQSPVWRKIAQTDLEQLPKLERTSTPAFFQFFTLDLAQLKTQLLTAPSRQDSGTVSNCIISFPDPEGNLDRYGIYEASVIDAALAAKYPENKSYVGQSLEHPDATIRFSITQFGLHSILLSGLGTSYIDPYTTDLNHYIVYKKQGMTTTSSHHCDVKDMSSPEKKNDAATGLTTDSTLRTYRLAMACTIEYAAFHINAAGVNSGTIEQKKAAVLAAMNVTVTRLNSVYERDLSVTMQLVANNDDIIFINSDNFDNSNSNNALLDQSQQVIDATIGFENYDIGHTVSTGGGGVAVLYSPCSDGKAKGITGLDSPVGDPYDIDFVAHEVGHQFGGNHSFNNSCGGNRSEDNSYEPGSGTTIMSYAGVCDPNVENHSDAQFHANSIREMSLFIAGSGNCSVNLATGNIPPIADAGRNYMIPKSTPFVLRASATDVNNDALTYCWEQMDKEVSVQPPLPDSPAGPNFRSLPPKISPERYFPNLGSVINNDLYPTWEVISDVGRMFNFACSVRDNNILGGQVTINAMSVEVSAVAGPFLVLSPNTNVLWTSGENQLVTWDVSGTTANGVNTPFVDIMLSEDGGLSYPVILASKVPNDGAETVTVPGNSGSANRIMIRGYDNIFYDLSNTNFTIVAPQEATSAISINGAQNISVCQGNSAEYTFDYTTYGNISGDATFTVIGNPAGTTIVLSPTSAISTGIVQLEVSTSPETAAGFYPMTVKSELDGITITVNIYLDVLSSSFAEITTNGPENNTDGVVTSPNFSWTNDNNATSYLFELATDADFSEVVVSQIVVDNAFSTTGLQELTNYFWRIRSQNAGCSSDYSEVFQFVTGQVICTEFSSSDVPVAISEFDAATITSELQVDDDSDIEKLSVTLDISHTWVGDLTVTLESPAGTQIQLFAQDCGEGDNVTATYDDLGSVSICGSNPVVNGLLAPDEPLSGLIGEPAGGLWKLIISDEFGEDGGSLNSWSLNFCSTFPLLSNAFHVFSDFSVYPNPNSGSFSLKFVPSSGAPVSVDVYDMRGRQILNRKFVASSTFEEEISLGDVASGVYMVKVSNGDVHAVKRIIVR